MKLMVNRTVFRFLIISVVVSLIIFALTGCSKSSEKQLINDLTTDQALVEIVGKWEVKSGTVNGIDYLNYSFNDDKTFTWIIKNANADEMVYKGTYKMFGAKVYVTMDNGNTVSNKIVLNDGSLLYDDVSLTKVNDFSAKEPPTDTVNASTNTGTNTNQSILYDCALDGCPNKTSAKGGYCTVHAKGKINTCLNCGAKIWSDETYCDDCLFGDFDFTEYGIDY